MGKKKATKGGKGGKAKSKASGEEKTNGETKSDNTSTVERHRELVKQAVQLKEQVLIEEREFNEFQQQREKLNYFWIVEKKNLEDKKAEYRNKERELQDLEEKHQVEIKVYKQRVKHLLFEHQHEVTAHKIENESTLSLAQQDNIQQEAELKVDQRAIKSTLKETELGHQDYLRSLKQQQDRAITSLRQIYERKAREMSMKFEKKSKSLRDNLEVRRKAEIVRIEQRKDCHIEELMKNHEKAFAEIKSYYNDITHNNLDLIKSLKEEVAEMKKKESADEKLMFEIAQENKRMSEPLKQALKDVERLRTELEDYNEMKTRLKSTKGELVVLEDQLKALKWEEEVLQQRFEIVESERTELYNKFQSTVFEVQQKTGLRNLLLEKKLVAISEELEKTDGYLNELLHQFNLDPQVMGKLQHKMDDILETKNKAIRNLQQGLLQAVASHNEMVKSYTDKLNEYGIPVEELGFVPKVEPVPQF